ncbi:MAG: DUF2326 domain-containing protein [Myxococcales bacterium]|nr:DUF2326 domain-containing protein [Myxococcales bacterium]
MRLIRLEANNLAFRTVKFNRSGLSIVVGQASQDPLKPKSKADTYNGVGKSLCFELIHFCLGSNSIYAFEQYLRGWIFSLVIETNGREVTISRSALPQSDIKWDNKPIKLEELRERLLLEGFAPTDEIPGLKFRPLIQPFLRSGRDAYSRFDITSEGELKNEYYAMLRNAFLLGLNVQLAQEKHDLRDRYTTLTSTLKQISSDPAFASLANTDKTDLEIRKLEEEAKRLDADLRAFKVAEDYSSIQQDADNLKRIGALISRDIVLLQDSIKQIERSLVPHPDVKTEEIEQAYAEVKSIWSEALKKRVEEVIEFQRTLANRREVRLRSELTKRNRELSEKQAEHAGNNRALDEKLQYLNNHMALGVFASVSARLDSIRQRIIQLTTASDQFQRAKREQRELVARIDTQTTETDKYLDKSKSLIEKADERFRQYVSQLYGSSVSKLSIENNDSPKNLQRYKIDVHIPFDAAEGINEAKIFCYDMTVFTLRRNHHIEFLGHDSSLFGPVDSRKQWEMIRLADKVCRESGLQYIAALNEHDVKSMQSAITSKTDTEEFKRIFSDQNVILRLTHDSRLLGMAIDMDYRAKKKKEE